MCACVGAPVKGRKLFPHMDKVISVWVSPNGTEEVSLPRVASDGGATVTRDFIREEAMILPRFLAVPVSAQSRFRCEETEALVP